MPSRHVMKQRKGLDGRIWSVVSIAQSEAGAAIEAGRLESAGIPVWIYRESAGMAIALTVGELGNVYLLTPEDRAEEAIALLGADESGLAEYDADSDFADEDFDEGSFEDEEAPRGDDG